MGGLLSLESHMKIQHGFQIQNCLLVTKLDTVVQPGNFQAALYPTWGPERLVNSELHVARKGP